MVDKVLHSQMPFTTGKQTINDRLTAAYHSLAGSQLGKTVCKATTEEEIGPKKKHLDYLLHCTNEPNVSIPQLANLLIERATSTNWCTVFKGLISIHNLMCYGNERFSQYLASSNANFGVVSFVEKTCVQGYDMTGHVRNYAKYIGDKVYTYRMMAFDFCKVKRGREDGLLRTMPTDRLLKTLPLLQQQIDSLLEFQVTSAELTNGVINSCFILLFRDLIRLFACYNDGMINLLEKFFDMNKKQCREAFDLYKSFLARMDRVAEFLKVAESVGIDKCEIPDLARAPSSLVEALEQHLAALEGQKATSSGPGSRVTSPTSGPSINTQNAIHKLSGSGFAAAFADPSSLNEQARRKILGEEEHRLNMMKEQRLKELHSQPHSNPFLQAPANETKTSSIDDLLQLDFSAPAPVAYQQPAAATNPFQQPSAAMSFAPAAPFMFSQQPAVAPFGPASYSNEHSQKSFASEDAFAKAFDPQAASHAQLRSQVGPTGGNVFKNDLDSSLASLAENLNITKGQEAFKNKPVQWSQQRPPAPQQQQYQAYGYPQQQQAGVWNQQQAGGANPMQYGMPYGQMYSGQQGAAMPGSGYGPGQFQQPQRPPFNSNASGDPFGTL